MLILTLLAFIKTVHTFTKVSKSIILSLHVLALLKKFVLSRELLIIVHVEEIIIFPSQNYISDLWVRLQENHFFRANTDFASVLDPNILVTPCDSLLIDLNHVLST